MEFDKTKVYTVVNADEVKAGSKGIFADTYAFLQKKVSEEGTDKVDGSYVKELVAVKSSRFQERFCMKSDDSAFFHSMYSLFYLVEEPKEDKYRPYKDTEEMIEDFCVRFNVNCADYELPLIWVRNKLSGVKRLIKGFDVIDVYFDNTAYCIKSLFENYTYLDGTPCGIKEIEEE